MDDFVENGGPKGCATIMYQIPDKNADERLL